MICSSCNQTSPNGMRFCGHCGASLSPAMAQIEPRLPPHSSLGAEAESSRRLVTVLFSDIVGFTPLSERLDPEDVREIQDAYVSAMSHEISRYGGTVEKYAGDAVLAVFGVPISHEDDAERAIRCALRMQEVMKKLAATIVQRWGVDLAQRIGINTGEVVSGLRQTESRTDYAVTGDVVNTAARLQAVAPPGGIVVGALTMQLSQRSLIFGPEQRLTLKGKSEPVSAYPVLRLRDHVVERWQLTARVTPLVGRVQELNVLTETWERTRTGQGIIVSLVGEAGIGKSRLLSEMVQILSPSTRVLRARCMSFTANVSLWLLSDLLLSIFVLPEDREPAEAQRQVVTVVGSLLQSEDEETRLTATDVVGELLGLPQTTSAVTGVDPRIRRAVLVRTIRLLLAALCREGPTLMVLEDMQWCDTASAEILADTLPVIHELHCCVLAAYRPEWTPLWAGWRGTETLKLQALGPKESHELARAVVQADTLTPDVESHLLSRSSGNPFFVEEIARHLADTGSLLKKEGTVSLVDQATPSVPSTLTGVLQARLDRLSAPARGLVQVASVIGRQFSLRLLAAMLSSTPESLQASLEEIEGAAIASHAGSTEPTFMFQHATVQEVAYGTLLRRHREHLHGVVASTMLSLYPEEESTDIIAFHYAQTQQWETAGLWLDRAGDRAARVYANVTALQHYREARRRLERCSASASQLGSLDAKSASLLGRIGQFDEALRVGQNAIALLERAGDRSGVATLTAMLGRWHMLRGSPREGLVAVQTAIARLEKNDPLPGRSRLYNTLARLHFARGAYREGLANAQRASALAEEEGDIPTLAEATMIHGTLNLALGRLAEGRRSLERAIPLAETTGDLETLSRVLNNLGGMYHRHGSLQKSRAYLEQAIAVYARMGDPGAAGHVFLTEVLITLGEWREAQAHIDEAAGIVRSMKNSVYEPYPLLIQGTLDLYQGNWKRAEDNLQKAIILAEPVGDLQLLGQAHILLAELETRSGRVTQAVTRLEMLLARETSVESDALATLARAYLALGTIPAAAERAQEAIDRAQAHEQRLFLMDALRTRALVLMRMRRWEEAKTAVTDAIALATAIGAPYAHALALVVRGQLCTELNLQESAHSAFTSACEIFRRLGAERDLIQSERYLQRQYRLPSGQVSTER